MKLEQCVFAGDRDKTRKLIEIEPSMAYAGSTLYEFCEGCKGFDTKCPYYVTKSTIHK